MADFACVAEFFVNGKGTGEELNGLVNSPTITVSVSATRVLFLIHGRIGTNVLSRVGIDFVRSQSLGDFELFFISLQMVLRRETNRLGT